MTFAAPEHVVGVEEMTRHEASNVNFSEPVVVVLSVYEPFAFATHVPETRKDPVTVGGEHVMPTNFTSSVPVTSRHDDTTVQVPKMLPPQAATLVQVPVPTPDPPLPGAPPPGLPPLELLAAPPLEAEPELLLELQPTVEMSEPSTTKPRGPTNPLRITAIVARTTLLQ